MNITIDNSGYIYAAGPKISIINDYIAKYSIPPSPSLSIDMKDTSSCSYTVDVPVRGKGLFNIFKLTGLIYT